MSFSKAYKFEREIHIRDSIAHKGREKGFIIIVEDVLLLNLFKAIPQLTLTICALNIVPLSFVQPQLWLPLHHLCWWSCHSRTVNALQSFLV